MNTFLDSLFREKEFQLLKKWSTNFWILPIEERKPDTLKRRFARRGYEEKGIGHINQIIANVGELLENYFETLYYLNKSKKSKIDFLFDLRKQFKMCLHLFFVSVHMHDIGMGFPEIYPPLTAYVGGASETPDHHWGIIHQFHHYTSFIILMELSYLVEENSDFNKDDIEKRPFLSKVVGNKDLKGLNDCLYSIYNTHFKGKFSDFNTNDGFIDFLVILAILCFLHKEFKPEYLQRILRHFQEKKKDSLQVFNKWWSYFERSKKWTDKMSSRLLRKDNSYELPHCEDAELLEQSGNLLDLALVEALLQYGDKTDITIARLVRIPVHEKVMIKNKEPFIRLLRTKATIRSIFRKKSSKVFFQKSQSIYITFLRTSGSSIHNTRALPILRPFYDKAISRIPKKHFGPKTTVKRFIHQRFNLLKLEMPFKTFLNETKYDGREGYLNTEIAHGILSDFARSRACCFSAVPLITVEKGNETAWPKYRPIPELDIIIHYLRFSGDDNVFNKIRHLNEKDFFDLDFLRVIRFHIPTLLNNTSHRMFKNPIFKLNFKKKEHPFKNFQKDKNLFINHLLLLKERIEKDKSKLNRIKATIESDIQISEMMEGLEELKKIIEDKGDKKARYPRKGFPYTRQNIKAIDKFAPSSMKSKEQKQVLYRSSDLEIPGSFEIVAVLNLYNEEE